MLGFSGAGALRFSCGLSLALVVACGGEDSRPGGPGGSGATGGALGGGAGSGTGGSGGSAGNASGGTAGSAGSAGAGASAGSGGTAGSGGSGGTGGSAAVCPPVGPYGGNVGDIAEDVTLYDCDGKPVSLHSLCNKKASAVFTFAIWCPICKAHMDKGEPQALYANHQNDDFEMFVVVTETGTGANATAAHCVNIRDTYGLKMPVFFDKNAELVTKLGLAVNSGALVMSAGARIELKQSYGFDAMAKAIPTVLAK